jgi:glycosyltransferase involved in cell wall biosynthesis
VLCNDYSDFEVIVVDDHSTDNTKEIVKSIKDNRLRLLANKENQGASYSRNRGVKNSKSSIIIFLDADSYVDNDWLIKHSKLHQDGVANIIAGGVIGIHKTVFGVADGFCNWWTSVPFSRDHYVKRLHIPTNNLSINKKVFSQIGYFQEELRLGGEDVEFCFRSRKNKIPIFFKSDLTIYHYDRSNYSDFIKHQEHWGKHAVKMHKNLKMEHSFLIPSSKSLAFFYVFPLALLYSGLIIIQWIKYKPSVILYAPLIFIGKLKQAIVIKNSFN